MLIKFMIRHLHSSVLHNHWTELSIGLYQTLFPRSGDVIHPQLWESGSGYETSLEGRCQLLVTRTRRSRAPRSATAERAKKNTSKVEGNDLCKISYVATSRRLRSHVIIIGHCPYMACPCRAYRIYHFVIVRFEFYIERPH